MKASLESLGRLRLQGILLLGVVFVIGGLAGAAFERSRRAREIPPVEIGRGAPPGWREQLHLTDEQEARIRQILESGRPRSDAILERLLPSLRAVTDSIRVEVRNVLTPEQLKIFDEMQPPLGPPLNVGHPPLGGPPQGDHPMGGPPPGGPHHGAPPPGGPPPGGPPPHGADGRPPHPPQGLPPGGPPPGRPR
jgi:hypothetical protein